MPEPARTFIFDKEFSDPFQDGEEIERDPNLFNDV